MSRRLLSWFPSALAAFICVYFGFWWAVLSILCVWVIWKAVIKFLERYE